jgi:hypothetical protein
MLECAREGCDIEYHQKTHNQKYCSKECCRLATNRRIMVKYYDNRDRKNGAVRMCKKCNETKLSRYNETQTCASCKSKSQVDANESVVRMLMNASLA